MKPYDYIIAGGGAAGLSLAFYLSLSTLKNRKILIIDKDKKNKNDRTWGFWSNNQTPYEEIVTLKFSKLDFVSSYYHDQINLGSYNYNVIQGIDFYHFVKRQLRNHPNFEFVQASVTSITDQKNGAEVTTNQGIYEAKWIFSSLFDEDDIRKAAASKLYLRQHFKGWVIETGTPQFSPESFTMFDFRTPQEGLMRFFYIIPYSETRALVEYTLFSEHLLEPRQYDQALKNYISEILGIKTYNVADEEFGVIPMTNYLFPASKGKHIVNIGSLGGSSKPSSGYTFFRIQKHVQKIVAALEAGKSPVISANSLKRYRFYDSVLLNILKYRGGLAEKLFSSMFKNNSIHRLFNFLDEKGGIFNDLKIITSLPPLPFARSATELLFRRRL
jgi:lycopene beta-cyclase